MMLWSGVERISSPKTDQSRVYAPVLKRWVKISLLAGPGKVGYWKALAPKSLSPSSPVIYLVWLSAAYWKPTFWKMPIDCPTEENKQQTLHYNKNNRSNSVDTQRQGQVKSRKRVCIRQTVGRTIISCHWPHLNNPKSLLDPFPLDINHTLC